MKGVAEQRVARKVSHERRKSLPIRYILRSALPSRTSSCVFAIRGVFEHEKSVLGS